MGVVFEVEDRRDGRHVALKALRHAAPELRYRLKREFRATAALVHPNVISLYELFVDGDDCCFTMELVDGVDFLTWVGLRDHYAEMPSELAHTRNLREPVAVRDGDGEPEPVKARPVPACDIGKLRAAARQLALGIHAIHGAGFVHRDIKPQNVLVDHAGVVRLLDLGLATDAPAGAVSRTDHVVGTVAYIAPEALKGAAPAPDQDWYAFGTLLYQALTGWLPFGGPFAQLVDSKLTMRPPPPGTLAHGIPTDLDRLCRDLLVPEPKARPGGVEILERLEAAIDVERQSRRITAAPLFAGRSAELRRLVLALDRVRRGELAVVHITGPSGIGKTELVQELLRRAQADDPRLVSLEGRCYPHEQVTYRAIDPLIDNLSRLWTTLPEVDAHRLLPRHAATLARLFPVLARVPAIASMPDAARSISADEDRRRGHAALREVLQRLADVAPLVLILDDVHLVDASTADLLLDVFRQPDAPVALLALISRSDPPAEGASGESGEPAELPLAALLAELGPAVETLELPPLGHAEAIVLARHVLARSPRAIDVDALAREAGGLPFFVIELARFAEKTDSDLSSVRIDRVIGERITGLDAAARRLLDVIAVAALPTPRRIAAAAAELDFDDELRQLRALRAAGLVRTEGSGDDETVEAYHERIRGAVTGELSPAQLSARHRALAVAYESGLGSAPDRLARHWLAAGDVERACAHALRAGRAAEAELDFTGAAVLYRLVLEHGSLRAAERVDLLAAIGEALACTGQPHEASTAFLEAADLAGPVDGLRLRSRAAGELLRGGYLTQGIAEIEQVLHALGMKLAPSPGRALLNLLRIRLRLRLRGFAFKPRPAAEIAPIERVRLDACYAVGIGLAMVDHLRGAEYNTRGLLLALDVGDSDRLSRALFLEIGARASHGDRATAQRLIDMTRALAAPLSEGYAQVSGAAIAAWADNDWPTAVEKLDSAMAVFRDQGRGAGWEHDTCQIYRIYSLVWLGEIAEVRRSLPLYLHEARRRGDRYALANLRSRNNLVWLCNDDPDGAIADLDEALAGWPRPEGTYHIQSYYALIARVDAALYRGRAVEAARLLEDDLPQLRRAHLMRLGTVHREVTTARVRTALALSARGDSDAAAVAEKQIRELTRSTQPIAPGLAHLFRGALADLYGRREQAITELDRAAAELEARRCMLYAAAARWRLAEVRGTPEGVGAAFDDLHGRGIRNPERLVRLLVPARE